MIDRLRAAVTGLEVQGGDDRVELLFGQTLAMFAAEAWLPLIRTNAAIVQDLLHRGHCHLAMLIPVPELTFTLTRGALMPTPYVMVPFDWCSRIRQDACNQAAKVLSVCSRVVDYFNDRYIGQTAQATIRADAFEAEFLLHVGGTGLKWSPSDHGKALLTRYPKGLQTDEVVPLLYEPKPYISLLD